LKHDAEIAPQSFIRRKFTRHEEVYLVLEVRPAERNETLSPTGTILKILSQEGKVFSMGWWPLEWIIFDPELEDK
jgi:hypothetical protein